MTDEEDTDIVRVELPEEKARDLVDILEWADRESPSDPSWATAGELATEIGHAIDGNRGTAMEWYQDVTEETAVYPDAHLVGADHDVPDSAAPKPVDIDTGLLYCVLGLNGEAGEVAEKVKKDLRGDKPDEPLDIGDELGDVLWYLVRTCDELGYSLDAIARRNVRKLTDRKERGVIKGSGDDR